MFNILHYKIEQQILFIKMHLLCSPVTDFSDMDTPEGDRLLPVLKGTIKLNFNTYQVYNFQCITFGSF